MDIASSHKLATIYWGDHKPISKSLDTNAYAVYSVWQNSLEATRVDALDPHFGLVAERSKASGCKPLLYELTPGV